MENDLSQKAKLLFRALIQLKDDRSRVAFLEKECAGNPVLKKAVIDLWVGDDSLTTESTRLVLASPPTKPPAPNIPPGPSPLPPGSKRISGSPAAKSTPEVGTVLAGKYQLLDILGQGGMGVVYRAQELTPPHRQVAIKLVKADTTVHSSLDRFRIEMEALSVLHHPNIAAVLEAATTEAGYPFFVMEFFRGIPITVFCDSRKLDPWARLRLFLEVCDAIQHAHEQGLIHRDIKPANILGGETDGKRWVKVIDFGLAKFQTSMSGGRKHLTRMGMVLGTLEYMSPEQAMARNEKVDARSDIYALGVLLFELLTGTTPLKKRSLLKQGTQEFLRKRGMGYIPKPSFKLSASTFLNQVASDRSIAPGDLVTLLRDSLDWILLQALEKDPNQRYQKVQDLAEDIRGFLEGRPLARGRSKRKPGSLLFSRSPYRTLAIFLLVLVPVSLSLLVYWLLGNFRHAPTLP